MFHKSILVAALVTAVFLMAGCAGSGGTTPAANQVLMKNTQFDPLNLTVKKGATVTWVNKDGFGHTVTPDTAGNGWSDDSGTVNTGKTYTHTFDTVGTFTYHCKPHGGPGVGMHGTITVTA